MNIFENAKVYKFASVHGHALIYGNAEVYGYADVDGDVRVFDDAKIKGIAKLVGYAQICGDAEVTSIDDYIVLINNWEALRYITWTRSNNMWKVDDFYGTGKQLIEKAYKDSEESGKKYKSTVNYLTKVLL